MKSKKGLQESIWLSNEIIEIVNQVRGKLGMTKSGFYRYAITHLLQEMSILSKKAKEQIPQDQETKVVRRCK